MRKNRNNNDHKYNPTTGKLYTRYAVCTYICRILLVLFTVIILATACLAVVLATIFNGPSESARDVLTMSLLEASATKWVPGLFLGQDKVEEIRTKVDAPPMSDVSTPSDVIINTNIATTDEWKDYPDGIRIESVKGETYNAHVMIIRDPGAVYMATSTDEFSRDIPGTRIHEQILTEGAVAAINAGAFNDDGTAGSYVGSLPTGLVISEGKVVWNDGNSYEGFVGFNYDNILVVAETMSADKAKELNIRDGCCFGPVLIMNGTVNTIEYSSNSGYNPRTAIGQRADGSVIFVCIDGRQVGSLGGTYSDLINIMVEYGAVNACNLDGGSSTVMLYKDTLGKYGTDKKPWGNDIAMINSYSLLQQNPRKMPTFFMVRPMN